jgi:glycosyltransferase involved in cell wall biosynthesis
MISNTAFSMWNFRRDVMADFVAQGHRISCLAVDDGVCGDHLRAIGVNFVPMTLTRSGANPFHEIKVISSLFFLIKKLKPDLIISYTIKPNAYVPLLAKLSGAPCMAVVTGLGYAFLKQNVTALVARFALRLGLIFATKIWFLNNDDMDIMCRRNAILKKKSSVLPSEGIDLDYFNDALFPYEPSDKFTCLMVARILKDKGVYEYAYAARKVREKYPFAEFQFLGGIDEENPAGLNQNEWDRLCAESGIIYLGTALDVRPIIARADICVLPSYREGIPLALLEGGAMRKPLIATNVAGCRDVIDHGVNGYLIESKNGDALAEAMIQMINIDKAAFTDMRNAARSFVYDRYRKDIVMKHYRDLLTEI